MRSVWFMSTVTTLVPESTDDELSRIWREESLRYVSAINAYVARGLKDGWEKAGRQPEDTRSRLACAVIAVVRRANQKGTPKALRDFFPPAFEPLLDLIKENGQVLPLALLLNDGRIVVRIGAPYETGRVVLIDGDRIHEQSRDMITVGRSPNRRWFAVARSSGVTVHDGWEGRQVGEYPWPVGREGVPSGFDVPATDGAPIITRLVPFCDGTRVLLISPNGVFVLGPDRAIRLLPSGERMREFFEWLRKEHPDDPLYFNLSMEHGDVSPDGRWIAAGDQDSLHYIYDATNLQLAGEIGNVESYPHYAAFSSDSSLVAFNSCHFYNGATIGAPIQLLPGLKTEPYSRDPRITTLQEGARVYAAVHRKDEFIVGDAYGYLRAFDHRGGFRWQHFIGSTIGHIDLSPDGKRLIVTSCAGFLCVIDLDTGTPDPFSIGTASHRERRRWLFWRNEPQPLIW
ncbi:MAG TPA: hypothetical protein VFB96_22280 [Pirellulaceae bacterium]|nr:hypothetical protein [Pirellulaceae bacterium]